MNAKKTPLVAAAACAIAIVLLASITRLEARRAPAPAPPTIDNDDIGGVVSSAKGPESGVWVIAETADLAARFVKIVVTDDRGRYVIPDLPKANYKVWVRGYGLIDSKPVQTAPGKILDLTATTAPSLRAAAQYYPANYWYSMIRIPSTNAFPMEEEGIQSQLDWVARMKNDIQLIQIGDKATREIPEQLRKFPNSEEAWRAWLKTEPPVSIARLNRDVAIKMYADWTDRIAAGEYPQEAPPRPQGLERSVVISEWDWGNDKSFVHDVITTYPPDPHFNANGLIYGAEQFSSDDMMALDPNTGKVRRLSVPMRDQNMPQNFPRRASLTWGDENIRPAKMRLHNQMFDLQGRVWTTAKFRNSDAASQPSFCKDGSENRSAKFFPIQRNRDLQVVLYEPGSRKFSLIDTCFSTHHLAFGEDPDHTLYFSSLSSPAVGWINTKVWDETHDAAKAQGWCPYIIDTNGNGKQDSDYQVINPNRGVFSNYQNTVNNALDPNATIDPTQDTLFNGNGYGIAYNPVDHSIWTGTGASPGYIVRVDRGPNPPNTCKAEVYNSPKGASTPKGIAVDRATGIVWVAFAGSGQFASFDRRKCKVLNGPTATGNHCPEGWTVYPQPGPKFQNTNITADWYYLNWVDQFDTLGLGKNIPMAPGTNSDSLIALLPESKWVVMRVPYPLGFYSRGMDGRIDDPNAGWKGRGVWTTYASVSPWNYEGGKGTTPKVVKFQVRPDPLAD